MFTAFINWLNNQEVVSKQRALHGYRRLQGLTLCMKINVFISDNANFWHVLNVLSAMTFCVPFGPSTMVVLLQLRGHLVHLVP